MRSYIQHPQECFIGYLFTSNTHFSVFGNPNEKISHVWYITSKVIKKYCDSHFIKLLLECLISIVTYHFCEEKCTQDVWWKLYVLVNEPDFSSLVEGREEASPTEVDNKKNNLS